MEPGILGQGFESDGLDSSLDCFRFPGGGMGGGSHKPGLLVSSQMVSP